MEGPWVSESERHQPTRTPGLHITLMREGLFATAAGTTLKNTGLIVDYLYELIKPACKGTVIFIILTPVSLVKKTCPGISGVPKICAVLLSVSPVPPLLIIFSHHWAFQLVLQPGGIVPPEVLHSFSALFLDCSTPRSSKFVFFLFIESYYKQLLPREVFCDPVMCS